MDQIAPHSQKKFRAALASLLVSGLATLCFPQWAVAHLGLHPWSPLGGSAESRHERPAQVGAELRYFSSQANWNRLGTPLQPPGLNYERLVTDLSLSHRLADAWTLFGRASLSGIRSQSLLESGGQIGFADQTVGVQYQFQLMRSARMITQFQADFPTYRSPRDSQDQLQSLGDGSVDFSTGAFVNATLPLGRRLEVHLSMGSGVTVRTGWYSAAIPWYLGAQFKSKGSQFDLGLTLNGLSSLKSDPHSYSPAFFRENLGRDQSLITGAMNPSWILGRIQLGYQWRSGTKLSVSASQSLWGQMAPQLTSFGIQLQVPLTPQPLSPSTEQASNQPLLTQSHPLVSSSIADQQSLGAPVIGKITKTNEKLGLIKINLGSRDGISVGDEFQVISPQEMVQNPVAKARTTHLRPHEAALEITESFQDVWISEECTVQKIQRLDRQNIVN